MITLAGSFRQLPDFPGFGIGKLPKATGVGDSITKRFGLGAKLALQRHFPISLYHRFPGAAKPQPQIGDRTERGNRQMKLTTEG